MSATVTSEDLWCEMLRQEHIAQVHKRVAYESARRAIAARKAWLGACQQELAKAEAQTVSARKAKPTRSTIWPQPLSDD